MQKSTLLTSSLIATVFLAGAVVAQQQAAAQVPAPPPPPMADAPHEGMPPMHPQEGMRGMMRGMMQDGEHGMMRGGEHGAMMEHRGPMGGLPAMGLIFDAKDKNLSAADVQVIAQAMLLRRGNHDWKVANVVVNDDKTIGFVFTTAEGGVIAKFSVDPHSGRMQRAG